ncbi:MAG: thioesterase domain-containing protein [Anaerolineae bacterium]
MKINQVKRNNDFPFIWFGDAWFADKLSADQTLYCIPSGRIQIEQTSTFIKAMAEHCLKEILAVQPKGPYLMGGFCFDAWIAYEVSQLLQERGQQTALMLMIECYTLDKEEQRFNGYANHVKKLGTGSIRSRLDYLGEIVPWGAKEEQPMDIPLSSMSTEDQVNLLTKYAMESYKRQPTGQPIELIFGTDSWHSSYYKFGPYFPMPKTGWFKTASGPISTYFTAGNHDTILEDQNVDMMAKLVQLRIDKIKADLGSQSSKFHST